MNCEYNFNILIIIILAVVFLPQYFVYASDTEITDKIEQQMLEKIDMSEIEKYLIFIIFQIFIL